MSDSIKKSAELLLKGARMLGLSCPNCISPIFQLKDDTLYCTKCNRQVILIENIEGEEDNNTDQKESKLDNPIERKIIHLGIELDKENDPDRIMEIARLIKSLKELII